MLILDRSLGGFISYLSQFKKQIPKKDILRMQDMLQNKTQVETVNFRFYFKVIIRQN